MSTVEQLQGDSSEQIRYVQCGLCSTILLVNVPYSNLSMVVSVRCGNCTGLLSVNMAKPTFIPFDLLTSLSHNLPKEGLGQEFNLQKHYCLDSLSNTSDLVTSYHNIIQNHEDDDVSIIPPTTPVVNKPPEKKQRAPSAYNQFIKEEIRRLKAENPAMAHKEAFKTAAKNWAHLPPVNAQGQGAGYMMMRKRNVM
ncbi:axial regulator YABBY 4-like [Benincasa hispida]|uniref:axial regulator YABBY 4-like n=1 Tax=Benincasa hispida TaxID=102211 RepID=UPI0019000EBA|nr:axial regulator YABBY 4-like [Benincasa hispida]